MLAPVSPFNPCHFFADLKRRLEAAQGRRMSHAEIGEIIGQPRSTAHFWFSTYRHPHLLAVMAALERLSASQRQAFIECYCRVCPSLEAPQFAPVRTELEELLSLTNGLTVIAGGCGATRSFVLSAFGHSWCRCQKKHRLPSGIDLYHPLDFVPVLGVYYVDGALPKWRIVELVLSLCPRLLTSPSPVLLCNGLWGSVPSIRGDLLRAAIRKHVILTMETVPSGTDWVGGMASPVHVVKLAGLQGAQEQFGLTIRRLSPAPSDDPI